MKKKSFPLISFIDQENGSAIIIAMLVLLALSIIGISTLTTSRFETNVATNDILSKKAFYSADGGIEIGREMIEQNLSCPGGFPTNATGITPIKKHLRFEQRENFLRVTDLDFAYQTTSNMDSNNNGTIEPSETLPSDSNADLWFGDNINTLSSYDTNNDGEITAAGDSLNLPHTDVLAFGDTERSTGNAILMLSGYKGPGDADAAGGGLIVYQIHSRYQNRSRNSFSYIEVDYRHVIGQEGNCMF